MLRDSAGCDRCSASAAFAKLPASTRPTRWFSLRSGMSLPAMQEVAEYYALDKKTGCLQTDACPINKHHRDTMHPSLILAGRCLTGSALAQTAASPAALDMSLLRPRVEHFPEQAIRAWAVSPFDSPHAGTSAIAPAA